MKYIRRTSQNFKKDFLKNLLLDRNVIEDDIDFLNKFFNPTTENLLDYNLLDDIDKAADLIEYHIKNGNKIYLCVDSDADGFTSSIIFYSYIIKNYRDKYPDFTIEYHIPESKEHGLRTLMNDLRQEKKYDLIVLPDAGSNDLEEHLELKQMGYDICCLDHHNVSEKSQNAIVVNNQSSENYNNKALSGVGVVYKLLQLLDERNGWDDANNYLDLVALGEISDMMDMNTLENRFICDYGLSHIKNFLFKTLIKKQSYSLFGIRSEDWNDSLLLTNELTQIKVAFYITPLINALIRVGTSVDKEKLFLAFFAGEEQVKSTKRGASENEMECLAE